MSKHRKYKQPKREKSSKRILFKTGENSFLQEKAEENSFLQEKAEENSFLKEKAEENSLLGGKAEEKTQIKKEKGMNFGNKRRLLRSKVLFQENSEYRRRERKEN